uniref:Uncharacterized protein n=1 Tax=Rhizophora mucronata TaxID=61149 RepID=A0A2P2PJ45_RHIMU
MSIYCMVRVPGHWNETPILCSTVWTVILMQFFGSRL